MNGSLMRAYQALPHPARQVAASFRGLSLRRWRYGPETERLVSEALERESWPADRWTEWQEERIARVLSRAATKVPYYRDLWSQRRRRGDRASAEVLSNWPILEKDDLRARPEAFVADDCDRRTMFSEHTSGTSGKPLSLWWSRQTVREWFALFEARWRRWNGVTREDRWGILGGQLIVPVERRKPPFWVWNAPMKQLYLSSYHLAPDLIPAYLDALESRRVRYLMGYTSSLYALALGALASGRRPSLEVILTNAEPLLSHQRETIREAFGCPVRETYGMSEAVAAASECALGSLHLWPEVGFVEVLDGSSASPAGELIATGLLNVDQPLIRYRVGDRVELSDRGPRCGCGRGLPTLKSVEGRADDVLFTPDGRRVGRLDPVFKSALPIREAQIIQEALRRVRIRYVPTPAFSPEDGRSLTRRLRDRMGDVEVVLEAVDRIPRSANGKFRPVVCALPAEERERLQRPSAFREVGS